MGKHKQSNRIEVKAKHRNPYALIASWRSGAGKHPDEKKAKDKRACRGRVQTDNDT